jgi:hypothetical protein
MPRANRYFLPGYVWHTEYRIIREATDNSSAHDHRPHTQRVQIQLAAVEAQVNAIAAAILREPSVQRLVYIANEVRDKPQRSALLVGW